MTNTTKDNSQELSSYNDSKKNSSEQPHQVQIQTNEDLIRLENNVERYQRFSPLHKDFIVAMVGFSTMQVPFTTTSILPCVPEIAETYHTTSELVNGLNGVSSAFMALSPLVSGPLTEIHGRRSMMIACAIFFSIGSVLTAVAPNLAVFTVFRCFATFGGTSFFTVGSSIVGDLFPPTKRARALSWVLFGTQIGPVIGPLIGGVIVSYTSTWRNLYWMQFAMATVLIPLYAFFLPETVRETKYQKIMALPENRGKKFVWVPFNPLRVLLLFRFPNIALVGFCSSTLLYNMYLLLTPIRAVMDPRFHLTDPIYSSLFYLAPGFGYLMGSFVGGHIADSTVKRYIKKHGRRIPEDRLRATVLSIGLILPTSTLIYGWCLEYEKGGYAIPIIFLFISGLSQTACFSSLNTYCVDSMPKFGSDAISGNYSVRYVAQSVAIATTLIMINNIGVGYTCTIAALLIWVSFIGDLALIRYGEAMRNWMHEIDEKRHNRRHQE